MNVALLFPVAVFFFFNWRNQRSGPKPGSLVLLLSEQGSCRAQGPLSLQYTVLCYCSSPGLSRAPQGAEHACPHHCPGCPDVRKGSRRPQPACRGAQAGKVLQRQSAGPLEWLWQGVHSGLCVDHLVMAALNWAHPGCPCGPYLNIIATNGAYVTLR